MKKLRNYCIFLRSAKRKPIDLTMDSIKKKCIHEVNYKNAVNTEQGIYGQRDVLETLTGRLTSSAMSSLKLRGLGLAL